MGKVKTMARLQKSKEEKKVVVVHAFNFSIWEAEPGGPLSLRTEWSTERVSG